MRKFLHLLILILIFSSCASKRFTKKAVQFEQAGLFQDAAEYYYQAVLRKNTNLEAKLGLQKNGQLSINSKLNEFEKSYKNANTKDAVYAFIDAEKYYNKLKKLRVDLKLDNKYREYYKEVKSEYLANKYSQALDLLNRDDFRQAYIYFAEIISIDKQYKDSKEHMKTCTYEPIYRQGNKSLDEKDYRKAYYSFDKIIKEITEYKESSLLKNEAQEKATISIVVFNTNTSRYSYNYRSSIKELETRIKAKINKLNNPFIKLISLDDEMISRGKINIKMAKLSGIKAILKFSITDIKSLRGKTKEVSKTGYTKYAIKTKNNLNKVITTYKYNKTKYSEISSGNQINLMAEYKLVSTDDNSIMLSDIIKLTNKDKIHYAKYNNEKDKNKLIPGYWIYKYKLSSKDVVKDNKNDIHLLNMLLKARKNIKSIKTLEAEIIEESAKIISSKINSYNPKL